MISSVMTQIPCSKGLADGSQLLGGIDRAGRVRRRETQQQHAPGARSVWAASKAGRR